MVSPAAAQRIEQPRGEPRLVLPPAMARALNAVLPNFRVHQLQDYPEHLWKPCRRCNRYQITSRSAPFAAIGDFNGDRVLDVVVDGATPEGFHTRAAILSTPNGFTASILSTDGVPPSAGKDRPLLDEWLELVKKGIHRSGYEEQPLMLSTDAFLSVYADKGAEILYLRDGRWEHYAVSD